MKERILGLDVGDKYIGVAVSDPLGITAQGIDTIRRSTLDEDFEKIKKLIDDYSISKLIVGLPKNMDGSIGKQGNKTVSFGNYLNKRLSSQVIFWDERLTTKIAENILIEGKVRREKRKQVIDKLAAQNILQSYMDSI